METTQAVKRYLVEKTEELIKNLPREGQIEVLDNLADYIMAAREKLELKTQEDKPTPPAEPKAEKDFHA